MWVIFDHLRPPGHIMPDHAGDRGVAYLNSGIHPDQAEPAAGLLGWHAERTRRPLIRAWAARCQALLSPPDRHDALFRQALHWHAQATRPLEEARTRLCYGQALRRAKKKAAARDQLTTALAAFTRLGAAGWAARTRDELTATGAALTPPQGRTTDLLTPREMQVAHAFASGATTRQAATTLFLSPKTVEYHLAHTYRKLGITTRAELHHALHSPPPPGTAPGDN